MMLGYIHKDQSQPHFRIAKHNIDESDIVQGIAEWSSMKLSYEDDKIMITKANIFHRLATHRMNAIPETDHDFLTDMTNLLNTKKYMVSTMFLTSSGPFRFQAAEAMYKLIKGIRTMTPQDTKDLFFAPSFQRPGACVAGDRYYDPNNASTSQPRTRSPSPCFSDIPGFLGEDHPDGPMPEATREGLSNFANDIINRRGRNLPSTSASHAIRPTSPRSNDSGEHESDREFIDDEGE